MITFNIQAVNGNYYRGHELSNEHGNCWCGDGKHALVFTIEQAREIVSTWGNYLKIVISVKSEPLTDDAFQHELQCTKDRL